jgi:hypothetical protein
MFAGRQRPGPVVSIALGAVDKGLAESKATGPMTEAQKGAVSPDTSRKIQRVEELNARSRKYNLPGIGSTSER